MQQDARADRVRMLRFFGAYFGGQVINVNEELTFSTQFRLNKLSKDSVNSAT